MAGEVIRSATAPTPEVPRARTHENPYIGLPERLGGNTLSQAVFQHIPATCLPQRQRMGYTQFGRQAARTALGMNNQRFELPRGLQYPNIDRRSSSM